MRSSGQLCSFAGFPLAENGGDMGLTTPNPFRPRNLVFLLLTLAAVGLELLHAFDGDPTTDPWTDLIVEYVPGEVTMAAIGALALWLPIHFGIRYWRKRKEEAEHGEG